MASKKVPLKAIAHSRSGDKGTGANVGIIAYTPEGYEFLRGALTPEKVEAFFEPMGVGTVTRYEMPNIGAFNFLLPEILGDGGSRSLRIDAQGKSLGMALLEMEVDAPVELLGQGD